MARSSKSTPHERTRTILFIEWQLLQRKQLYRDAVEECLSNLQTLHDEWVTQQQTLGPRPVLSANASALATEIEAIPRRQCSPISLAIRPPRLEDRQWLLFDLLLGQDTDGLLQTLPAEAQLTVAQELLVYWQWQQANEDLNGHIAAYKELVDTLEGATNLFYSWDPALESLPGQSSKTPEPGMFKVTPEQFTLGKFVLLCSQICQKPAFLQQFPPLATLRHQCGILLPLDPKIPQLPFAAAWAVFPDIRPHYLKMLYAQTEPRFTITLTCGPGASKDAVQAEFDKHLSAATSRVNHRRPHYGERVQPLSYYSEVFQAYDLKESGYSYGQIAQQLWPKDFQANKGRYLYPNQGHNKIVQRAREYVDLAKQLISSSWEI